MRKPPIRVCVDVDNLPRQILTFKEDKKGMILITTKTGDYLTDGDGTLYLPQQFKTTVHPKDDSLTEIAIHTTIELKEPSKRYDKFLYTAAVKDGVGFVTVYLRRCVILSKERYERCDLASSDTIVRIAGKHNPATEMLFYSVVVGPRDAEVPFLPDIHLSTTIHRCSRFSLIVLLANLSVPRPVQNGAYILPETFKPENVPEEVLQDVLELRRGVPFTECVHEFWAGTHALAAEHMAAEFKSCPENMPAIRATLAKSFYKLKTIALQHMDFIRPAMIPVYFRQSFWKIARMPPDPLS